MVGEFQLRDSKKTATAGGYCKKHKDEDINYYCETCDVAICWTCLFEEHRTHVTPSGMRNIEENVKKKINKYVEPYAASVEGLKDRTDSLEHGQQMRGTRRGEKSELNGMEWCLAIIGLMVFIYFIYFLSSCRVRQYEVELLVAREVESTMNELDTGSVKELDEKLDFHSKKIVRKEDSFGYHERMKARLWQFHTGKPIEHQGSNYMSHIVVVSLIFIIASTLYHILMPKEKIKFQLKSKNNSRNGRFVVGLNGQPNPTNADELAVKKLKRTMVFLAKHITIPEKLWIRIGEEIVKLTRSQGTRTFSSILFYPQHQSCKKDCRYLHHMFFIAIKNTFSLCEERVVEINQATGVYENLENSAFNGKPVVLVSDELEFPLASSMAMDWFTSSRGNKPNGFHVMIADNNGQHPVIGRNEDDIRNQLKDRLFYWMLSKEIQRRLDETIVVIVPERSSRH